MLKTPHFNCRMNALKEVSRLIDESKAAASSGSGVRFASSSAATGNHIGIDQGCGNISAVMIVTYYVFLILVFL